MAPAEISSLSFLQQPTPPLKPILACRNGSQCWGKRVLPAGWLPYYHEDNVFKEETCTSLFEFYTLDSSELCFNEFALFDPSVGHSLFHLKCVCVCFNNSVRGYLLGTREGRWILGQRCSDEIDEKMSWIYSFVNDGGCRKQDVIAFGNSHNEQDKKTVVPLFIFSK